MILFVTGTDTGVGKTVASAHLAAAAVREGRSVAYVKPVQTGSDDDAAFVAAFARVPVHTLIRFEEPLAPAVAAARAGTPIDFEALAGRTKELAASVEELIVEGAGGLLVPLTEDRTMADLASALGAELVIVARPGLGTLNHVALTLEAAAGRGLVVKRLIVCGYPRDPEIAEVTNFERLRSLGLPFDVIPWQEGLPAEGKS